MSYKAQYKNGANQTSWTTKLSAGSETSAMAEADRLRSQGKKFVRVVDKNGNTIWTA